MEENKSEKDKPKKFAGFIQYLEGLKENRGAMAALRKGLGQPPGTVTSMYRYIESFIQENKYKQNLYYLIAALFAFYETGDKESGKSGNMGDHFRQTMNKEDFSLDKESPVEKRFTALLAAEYEDLCEYHLRQALSFLKTKDVSINWRQLMDDLTGWSHPDCYIQRRWAGSFWGERAPAKDKLKETKGE